MKIFAAILQYLPYVLNAVSAVETTVGNGNGATKKALVMNSITAAASVGATVPEAHVQAISALVDLTVGDLNNSGVFTKGVVAPKA